MSLIFFDGFDHYTAAQQVRKWSSVNNNFTVNSGARIGSSGQYIATNGNSNTAVKNLGANYQTVVSGCGVRWNSGAGASRFMSFRDSGNNQIELCKNSSGILEVRRNNTVIHTSGVTLNQSQWYFFELKVKVDPTTGTVDVWIDGANVVSLTGQNTRATANSYANQAAIGEFDNSGVTWHFDDFYVLDTGTGSAPYNARLGDCKVATLYPSGAGSSTQWTPSAGSNYQCVDEAQANDDTDYVSSATVGQIDSYAMGDLSIASLSTIYAVQVVNTAKKDDAGSRVIHNYIKSSSATAESGDIALSTSYAMAMSQHLTDPNTSAAWTVAGVNAMEVGAKVIS